MTNNEYSALVKKHSPKEPRLRNAIVAFLVGGLVGLLGETILHILNNCFNMPEDDAGIYLCLIVIFISSLFTGLGFFDNWVNKTKCGLIIPTTGFAHSVTSSAIDYKQDGLITGLGSNLFKLAGSVILYGVISAFFLAIVSVIING
jgi:stage V sporulation protein AC